MKQDVHNYRRYRWPSRSLLPIRRFGRPAEGRIPDTAANVRTAAIAMVVAFALFVVFGSAGMRHFARDLPGNRVTDVLVQAADQWHALMLDLGPARVRPAVRRAFDQFRTIRW